LGLPSSSWKEKEFKKKEKEKSDQGDIDSFLFSNFFFYKCSCLILILGLKSPYFSSHPTLKKTNTINYSTINQTSKNLPSKYY